MSKVTDLISNDDWPNVIGGGSANDEWPSVITNEEDWGVCP
jgi:hypothetical protein